MNVTLRQFRAFVAVAETKHFTQAAEKLEVSQSTISTLVRELEHNLNLRLFDRHTRMLRLTIAGAELLPLVRKVLADIDTVIGSSDQLRALGRGRVTIAAASVQAAFLVPPIMQRFRDKYPKIEVNLHDVSQPEVYGMVRQGEVDFGIGTKSESQYDLATQVLVTDHYVALVPPGHPLEQHGEEITWQTIKDYPLVGPPAGNPVREHLDFALAREGIALRRRHEIALPLTMIGMVESGLGVAIMTSAVTKLAHAFGASVKKMIEPVVEREVSLLFQAERSLSPAAQTFRDMLLQHRSELVRKMHEL